MWFRGSFRFIFLLLFALLRDGQVSHFSSLRKRLHIRGCPGWLFLAAHASCHMTVSDTFLNMALLLGMNRTYKEWADACSEGRRESSTAPGS